MGKPDSKKRFLETTARLLREHGYAATGTNDIVAASASPKGSLYFHFPGGKEELAALALTVAGTEGCNALQLAFTSNETVEGALGSVFQLAIEELQNSGFRAGCPIGTIAAEAPDAPRVCKAVAHAFLQWHTVIENRLVEAGVGSRRADELAQFVLTAFEGAIVLAKAAKSPKPLKNALWHVIQFLHQENVR